MKKRVNTKFRKARNLENRYARELRAVAKTIGKIVGGFPVGTTESARLINKALAQYAELLKPWAKSVAGRLIAQLDEQDKKTWAKHTKDLSEALRNELDKGSTGDVLRALMDEQVHYITSLPLEAAQRVHRLTQEGLIDSTRAASVRDEILRTTEVTTSRAMLIARTETGRAQATLMQARAQGIGSEGYLWRTARDSDVRKSHHDMEGQFVRWDSPPTLDKLTGHAGCVPNCRCYPEPVIPENFGA